MTLTIRPKPYIVPEYSLTGDLLSFLTCGLQYRYYNKAALPPSTPVQLWFGEFLHGVMEESFDVWSADPNRFPFPWDWATTIRDIEMRVHERLLSRGLYPPPRLFCPYPTGTPTQGLCADAHHPHQLIASQRTDRAINTWGRHLFPLVTEAEVKLKGSRPMPGYVPNVSRSNYYAVTGVVDVIGSVSLRNAAPDNRILQALSENDAVAARIQQLGGRDYDVIIDYKGMRRPAITDSTWERHQWQIMTYTWLRANQAGSRPIVAGILFYLNELYPAVLDFTVLREESQLMSTDIPAADADLAALTNWRTGAPPPNLSATLREARSMRIMPIHEASVEAGLNSFDAVVQEIEGSVIAEVGGQPIRACWRAAPEDRTCTACDFKTFCPVAAPQPYHPSVP